MKYFEWYRSSFKVFMNQLDLLVSEGEGKIYSGYMVFIQLIFEYLICAMDCVLTLMEEKRYGKWQDVGKHAGGLHRTRAL